MSGYLVCSACGARMRADRLECLRCHASLADALNAAAIAREAANRTRTMAVVGGVFVVLAGLIMWGAWRSMAERPSVAVAVPAPSTAPPQAPSGVSDTAPVMEPVTAGDYARLGGAAFSSGDFASARQQFEDALAKDPDNADVLNKLGLTLERLGRVPDAIEKFRQAAQLQPEVWAYRFNLAHAYGGLSQWDRAVTEYRRAAGLFPSDYATQFNLASALHKSGNDAAAVPEFEKAIALAPGEASYYLALGDSLAKLGRVSEARQAFQQYLKLEPDGPKSEAVKAHLGSLD